MSDNVFEALDKIIPTSHVQITGTLDKRSGVHTVRLSTFAPGSRNVVIRAEASDTDHAEACRVAAEKLALIWQQHIDRVFQP